MALRITGAVGSIRHGPAVLKVPAIVRTASAPRRIQAYLSSIPLRT